MADLRMKTTAGLVAVLLASSAVNSEHKESTGDCFGWSEWSTPVNLVAVNSSLSDQNPALSRDELTLYFTSTRPGGIGNLDLWVAQRPTRRSEWDAPVNLGTPINSVANDLAPTVSSGGHLLFFGSDRPGGFGSHDVYVSQRADTSNPFAWSDPLNVGSPINTADQELAPFYFHGSLYFNRGLQQAQLADIYHAALADDGDRNVAVVRTELNSPMNDAAVTIRRDGLELFLWSQRQGGLGAADIWTSTRRSVHHPWLVPTNVGAPINSEANDATPNLSSDGRTLIFASARAGGMGGFDLYTSTRRPLQHSPHCDGDRGER